MRYLLRDKTAIGKPYLNSEGEEVEKEEAHKFKSIPQANNFAMSLSDGSGIWWEVEEYEPSKKELKVNAVSQRGKDQGVQRES